MPLFCVLPPHRLETNLFVVVVHLVLHPGSPNIDPHIRLVVCEGMKLVKVLLKVVVQCTDVDVDADVDADVDVGVDVDV